MRIVALIEKESQLGFLFLLVLLYAHVERFSVSCRQIFLSFTQILVEEEKNILFALISFSGKILLSCPEVMP